MTTARELAEGILELLDDPYKAPESLLPLIRESCGFVMAEEPTVATIDNRCTLGSCSRQGEYVVTTHACSDCGAGPFEVLLTQAHSRPARVDCPECKNPRSIMTKAERA